MTGQIYPKPFPYYASPLFEGERATPVAGEAMAQRVRLLGADAVETARIASQLDTVKFRRFGRLRGQYMLLGGMSAIDRSGAPLRLFVDTDSDWAHYSAASQMERYYASEDFLRDRDLALSVWDSTELVGELPLLAEAHASKNYYHFTIQLLPKIRHFPNTSATLLAAPQSCIDFPFQRGLFTRTLGERRLWPIANLTRVQDPILVNEPVTAEALDWLRDAVGQTARRGDRRLYVARRASLVGRSHGGLLETDAFLRFLERHSFEIIDFGAGEVPLSQQIALLDGAHLILSAHGANLTNIVFAEAGIGVIEVFPWYWPYTSHLELALRLGLPHLGLICRDLDQDRAMRPDIEGLETALALMLRETQ